jgi:hypothetical protein
MEPIQVPSETELLKRRLELLELEQRKQLLGAGADASTQKTWWGRAIQFLTFPAAVLAIVLQLTQASGDIKTQANTDAETVKAKADTAKSLLETEKLQLELAELRHKGTAVPRAELEKLVPRLEASVAQLRTLQSRVQSATIVQSLGKFVVLWILFHAIGLISDVLQQVWGPMLAGGYFYALRQQDREDLSDRERRRLRVVRRVGQWTVMVLGPVPNVLRWSLQLSIFVALMIPLFDEVIRGLGSSMTFESVIAHARSLELGEALASLKAAMFAGAK